MNDDTMLYRILAQTETITLSSMTNKDVSFEKAKEIGKKDVLLGKDVVTYEPCVVVPVTTQERWEERTINFCPRCGANLHEYELEPSARFDCLECETSMDIDIINWR